MSSKLEIDVMLSNNILMKFHSKFMYVNLTMFIYLNMKAIL